MLFTTSLQSAAANLLAPLRMRPIISTLPPTAQTEAAYTIGTHDGSFHCDEALAVGMLNILNPDSAVVNILRTRNPELLARCPIVVDVGAVYDAASNRFDHHQRGFTETMEGFSTKLSSAGLVYKHFGHDIIKKIVSTQLVDNEGSIIKDSSGSNSKVEGDEIERSAMQLPDATINMFHSKIYKDFIEHIDAIDNGISVNPGGEPLYRISTSLSSRVGHLNPSWNEPQDSDTMNDRFRQAMILTTEEFMSAVLALVTSWWPARSLVQDALEKRFSVHESGQIIVFSQALPWKEHLFEIEEATADYKQPVLYALYPDSGGSWRIQAVPVTPSSFESRKKLPSDWCGVRDEALSKLSGVDGCIFVHASGFIGGNKTKNGALEMAIKALSM